VPGRALSGGQRSRLAMACVSFLRPHVLVLDGAHDARLMIQERKKKNLSFLHTPNRRKSLSFAKTGLGNKVHFPSWNLAWNVFS
jgi:ABC-type microcin C transport system duplicated ATPase subunit YejF